LPAQTSNGVCHIYIIETLGLILDLRKIPVNPLSPGTPITPFSAVIVSLDTLPSEKKSSESSLDDSSFDEVSRKSSIHLPGFANLGEVSVAGDDGYGKGVRVFLYTFLADS